MSPWTFICVRCGKRMGVKDWQNSGGWCARCAAQRPQTLPRAREGDEDSTGECDACGRLSAVLSLQGERYLCRACAHRPG